MKSCWHCPWCFAGGTTRFILVSLLFSVFVDGHGAPVTRSMKASEQENYARNQLPQTVDHHDDVFDAAARAHPRSSLEDDPAMISPAFLGATTTTRSNADSPVTKGLMTGWLPSFGSRSSSSLTQSSGSGEEKTLANSRGRAGGVHPRPVTTSEVDSSLKNFGAETSRFFLQIDLSSNNIQS